MSEQSQDGTKDGKACCGKSCCGKALAAFALLAIGGLGGYIGGRYCAAHCAVKDAPAAAVAPAATATPAK